MQAMTEIRPHLICRYVQMKEYILLSPLSHTMVTKMLLRPKQTMQEEMEGIFQYLEQNQAPKEESLVTTNA